MEIEGRAGRGEEGRRRRGKEGGRRARLKKDRGWRGFGFGDQSRGVGCLGQAEPLELLAAISVRLARVETGEAGSVGRWAQQYDVR